MATLTRPVLTTSLESSPYQCIKERNANGRTIAKYSLKDTSSEAVQLAAQAITRLLQDNPHLCAVFPTSPPQSLEQEIQNNPFLTINGEAVCLSNESEASALAPREYRDKYFSEALIKVPVRCPNGHIFEQERAEKWKAVKGNVCPESVSLHGIQHGIGNLIVDEDLQYDIDHFRTTEASQREQTERMTANHIFVQTRLRQQDALLTPALKTIKNVDPFVTKMTVGKVIVKSTAKKAMVQLAKVTASDGAKHVSKMIPFLNVFLGISSAIHRYSQGEYVKAIGELTSGAVSCIPGIGTGISIALDLGMMSHDIYTSYRSTKEQDISPQSATINITEEGGYQILNLKSHPRPTKKDVDCACRNIALAIHPDKLIQHGQELVENHTNMMHVLDAAKQAIYIARGWS
jgi:hypothetical protein